MILGITGGFGCGKSSVLRFFASCQWFTMDADAVCRGFYESGNPALLACVRENFGKDMFFHDGSVDRKKLGGELFRHPEKMVLVTGVLYPLLTEKLRSSIAACRKNGRDGAFEIPLLYEAGFEHCFDAVLSVWCPPV